MFKILKETFRFHSKNSNSMARRGVLKTIHGVIKTPFFMPIATRGAVKGVSSRELEELDTQIILANTYHLMLRPGEEMIKNVKIKNKNDNVKCKIDKFKNLTGLHAFMHWPGPILTDSGGFQVFSLAKSRKITERGIEFQSDLDGKKYLLTPEKSIEVQMALGSDIIMVLDECVAYPAKQEYVKKSVELTTRWAERCKQKFKIQNSKFKSINQNQKLNKIRQPLLFGIVQGGIYKDLRRRSAQDLIKLCFDGYAIGGLAVGEPREKMWEIVEFLSGILPKNKPRYLMGVGMPDDIVRAVSLGCDMFDCVIPTRNARHGELFKLKTQGLELKTTAKNSKLFYEIIHITNAKYRMEFVPIDENCDCFTCQNYTLAYLHHLFRTQDFLGQRLATLHNIKFYLKLMNSIRKIV